MIRDASAKLQWLKNFACSVWTFWFVITCAYTVTFAGGHYDDGSTSNRIHATLGAFTPIWFGALAGAGAQKQKFILPLAVLALLLGDIYGRRLFPRAISKCFYNLAVLLVLTMAIDLIVWHECRSLAIMAKSFQPHQESWRVPE